MKRQKMIRVMMMSVALSVVTMGGCTPKTDNGGDGKGLSTAVETESGTETGTEEETLDAETMGVIKYNIYVELNNYMVEVMDNIDNYYLVVEDADEFSMVPDSGYTYKFGISPMNSDIVDDATSVVALEPAYEELDDLVLQIAGPMKILMDTFSDIYHCNNFADNQYAKPKEFHVPVRENAAEFQDLAYQFMEAISEMSGERMAAGEQKMLDEGQIIAYNASHMITLGKQILDECYKQEIDDANITELDLTEIRPLFEELKQTVDAFNEATGDNNQLMKESLSSSTPMYGLPGSLVQSVEWMIKQVESGRPIPDPGSEYLGGIIHIEQELSECIDQYNTVFAGD